MKKRQTEPADIKGLRRLQGGGGRYIGSRVEGQAGWRVCWRGSMAVSQHFEPSCTFLGPKKVFQLSKESGIGKEEMAVCGGGHVTNKMKEKAAGY